MEKPKIAIACQGGGSQTAFTAGVFKALFENNVQDYVDIVSLTGTSGGAICAFLIWYSLKKGDNPVWQRLIDFWKDNSAQTYQEHLFNDLAIKSLELVSKGQFPQYNLSPYSPLLKNWFDLSTVGLRKRFTDFEELLNAHIDFAEIEAYGPQTEAPICLLGACNIITGKLHKFNSYYEPIKMKHILASACIPNIFPSVEVEGMAYWDGLFSDNPPIHALIKDEFVGHKNLAQEIWVIKINPTTTHKIPTASDDIADRHNELVGNVSLFQSLRQIEDLNNLFLEGAFRQEYLDKLDMTLPVKIPKSFAEDPDQPYHIPMIEMSEELARTLNYESKLDRSSESINRLIEDGEKQGKKFLEARFGIMKNE